MSLLEKLQKASVVPGTDILKDSTFFTKQDIVQTEVPIINAAFSGELDGGIAPGLTMVAGESRSFKTLLCLYAMRAFLKKYSDGVAILYDSEFGITPEYLLAQEIDTSRVIHVPIENVEQLKFDMVKKLEEIKRGDRVFFMIDSIGGLASKKEIEDALDQKSVADMTRAKAIRSLLRIIVPHLSIKNISCLAIAHVYKTMDFISKDVMSGGTALVYYSNTCFRITRAQEKDSDGEISGYRFTINIDKSRFVREKSKLSFNVSFDEGINKWSGLFDLALEAGIIENPKKGWYCMPGEDKNFREKDTNTATFWVPILKRKDFQEFVRDKYKLPGGVSIVDEIAEVPVDDLEE